MAHNDILSMPVAVAISGAEQIPGVQGGMNVRIGAGLLIQAGQSGSVQNANAIFAGPISGAAAVPTFRALVNADIATAGAALTKTDDTNVTLTLGGSPASAVVNPASLTLGWTGTLAAGRLNANVVQAVTNDTNVTGSIAAQNLTLGWTGQLAVGRGGTGVATASANTFFGGPASGGAASPSFRALATGDLPPFNSTDVASASTCDIGATSTPVVRITGTTTITSLGSVPNTRRWVYFSGTLTLTYNATSLILPGLANITTQAGDSCTFISDASGNWRCFDYTRTFVQPSVVETGSTVVSGNVVSYLNENQSFGGTYLGWVNNASSAAVIGCGQVTITGTPTNGESVSIRIQWGGGDITKSVGITGASTNITIAGALAAAIAGDATLTAAGFFTYQLVGTNQFNLQWLTTTPATVVVTPTNSVHTTVTVPAPSTAVDAFVFQIGRTYGRVAQAGDTGSGFDWTGPSGASANLVAHWAQLTPQMVDPSTGKCRVYASAGYNTTSGAGKARFYWQEGLVLYDDSQGEPSGGDKGAGSLNLPMASTATNCGVWFGGAHRLYYDDGSAQFIMETSGKVNISASGGVGINVTPTGNAFASNLGGFFAGSQVPTTGAGISLTGGATSIIRARNYGTSTDLPLELLGTQVALGAAGTLVPLVFANASTGTITLQPVTGALGSSVLSLPAATDTVALLAAAQEFTNKTLNASVGKGTWTASGTWTLPAFTLGGTVSGGGNQINNVIIGNSTPLAGSFTTVSASTSLTSPIHYGGAAAASTLLLQSTSNGSPSGDSATLQGTTINLRGFTSQPTTVNFGAVGLTGATLVVAGGASGTQSWKPAAAASGTITWPAGTVDFSATGGTSQVVKQTSSGGIFTIGQLAFTDLSGSASMAQLGSTSYAAGIVCLRISGVNFNSANTDNAIAISLPTGFTRYQFINVAVSHASATLTTATCGLFTATGGGGTAIVAAGTAITVSTASDDTNNNMQFCGLFANNNTTAWSTATTPTIYFRVGTAEGSAATGDVTILLRVIS